MPVPVAPAVESLKNVFVKFGSKTNLFLSDYLDMKSPETRKRSDPTKALDAYSLLQVVQSKSDKEKSIYKVGVSKGVSRLNEYLKMHGDSVGRCSGVYLIDLAGVKTRPNVAASKQWNYEKESQIKQTLKTRGNTFRPWSRMDRHF
jgi:hypothetical protein